MLAGLPDRSIVSLSVPSLQKSMFGSSSASSIIILVCLLYLNCATLQGPGSGSFNLYVYEVARLNGAALIRLGEEYQFVGAGPSFPLLASMTVICLLNQDLFGL